MIQKIKIDNFKGIDKVKTISFVANAKRKSNKLNITKINSREILLVNSLLGANAIGKTSFISGISFVSKIINGHLYSENLYLIKRKLLNKKTHQYKDRQNLSLSYQKSKLEKIVAPKMVIEHILKNDFNDPKKPINFEIEFINSKNLFKLNIDFLPNGVIKENIYKNNKLFSHSQNSFENFKSNIYKKELGLKKLEFRYLDLLGFLPSNLWLDPLVFKNLKNHKSPKYYKDLILRWSRIADSKIMKIIWTSKNVIKAFVVVSENGDKKIEPSNLSSGTLKWLKLAFIAFEFLFIKQGFVFIDDIEKSLHPSLVRFLITLFGDLYVNKKRSQLLFTTHSPYIVDIPFRKDAINYIDMIGEIQNLGQLGVREDINVSKNYISGKIGSHPIESDMYEFVEDFYD